MLNSDKKAKKHKDVCILETKGSGPQVYDCSIMEAIKKNYNLYFLPHYLKTYYLAS